MAILPPVSLAPYLSRTFPTLSALPLEYDPTEPPLLPPMLVCCFASRESGTSRPCVARRAGAPEQRAPRLVPIFTARTIRQVDDDTTNDDDLDNSAAYAAQYVPFRSCTMYNTRRFRTSGFYDFRAQRQCCGCVVRRWCRVFTYLAPNTHYLLSQ